jgi:hypothetical protein
MKDLLPQAAEREWRSVASMVEVLVLAIATEHRLRHGFQVSPLA